MKSVSKIILGIVCLMTASQSIAQSTSEKLKREQQQLENNIANTKQLLEKAKSNTESSFNELKLLNNQIAYREQLVRNFDNQIRGAELKIKEKQNQIEQLSEEMKTLREQYKKLLIYAYKHRNKYGKMMYIFSSDSYYEAIKRAKYLEKIQEMIKTILGRGVTVYKGIRGHGKSGSKEGEIHIIYTVITRLEVSKLNFEIEKIDPGAFVVMTRVKDTKGGMIKHRPLH